MNNLLNENEPIYLPQGSVRSIIAIMAITTICGMIAFGRIVPNEFYTILGTILGFYFGSRK